jgi:hypothetical protein
MKEMETAKKANDQPRIAELEQWGVKHQKVLHLQGFGRVPVGDLLEPVKDGVEDLLKRKELSAITMHCDATARDVETVDITMDLVRLFDPSSRTIRTVEELKDIKPMSLSALIDLPVEK